MHPPLKTTLEELLISFEGLACSTPRERPQLGRVHHGLVRADIGQAALVRVGKETGIAWERLSRPYLAVANQFGQVLALLLCDLETGTAYRL